jgi:hypothetical protein
MLVIAFHRRNGPMIAKSDNKIYFLQNKCLNFIFIVSPAASPVDDSVIRLVLAKAFQDITAVEVPVALKASLVASQMLDLSLFVNLFAKKMVNILS